jgi:hypothetical protein
MKSFRLKLAMRLLAVMDILFCDRFELKAWDKGTETNTRFDKKEINRMFKK